MGKGFILVDNIPHNCCECNNHNYHFCSWTGDNIEEYINSECSRILSNKSVTRKNEIS